MSATLSLSDLEKPKFNCKICDANFACGQNLIKHEAAVHEGEKAHKCPSCNSIFTSSYSLTTHISSIYKGEKPFKCDTCDAKFSQHQNFKNALFQFMKEKSHSNVSFAIMLVLGKVI